MSGLKWIHWSAILFVLPLAVTPSKPDAAPDTYVFDPSHTEIIFSVDHMGFSTIYGEFQDYDGDIVLDPQNLSESSVDVTIEAESIDTDWQKRDEHFRSADFFDVENYPTITFESTSIQSTGDDTATMTGDLTIKDITHPVTLAVTLNGRGESPVEPGTYVAGFNATTTLKRSRWDLGAYAPAVSDEVQLTISTELNRVDGEAG